MQIFKKGDLVVLNGNLAAVVGLPGDPAVPPEHVALWLGEVNSSNGSASTRPIAWTVPVEYCKLAPKLEYRH